MADGSKRGETIGGGQYRLLSKIGTGGFGDVYLADAKQGGLVAVKIVDTSSWNQKEYRVFNAMLVNEASFLSTLRHRSLPALKAFFAEGSRYFLVMEWVKGRTLEELVEGEGALELEEGLHLLECLLEALGYLHQECEPAVVFGDIKPANVLRASDGTYRLVDLGCATRVGSKLSGTFAVFSPDYSAPERAHGEVSSLKNDLYSLAATFNYALTGMSPAEPGSGSALRAAFREGARHWGESAREAVKELYQAYLACLSPDPATRPELVSSLATPLEKVRAYLEGDGSQSRAGDILGALYKKGEKELSE